MKSATEPRIVFVEPTKYLAISGSQAPWLNPAFGKACSLLLDFVSKLKGKRVALEALWYGPEGGEADPSKPETWMWTAMVAIEEDDEPDAEQLERFRERAASEGLAGVEVVELDEGEAAEFMHVGPLDKLGESVAKLMRFIFSSGFMPSGKLHEIYMDPPESTPPEKLRVLLRKPVRKPS